MSIDDDGIRYHLTIGLIGPNETLYQTSATFRGCVDTLAAMLPSMVDGLVTAANGEDAVRRDLAHKMMHDMLSRPVRSEEMPPGFRP